MGYNDLDRALLDAWARAYGRYKENPKALEAALQKHAGPTYTRPLRSWSLVLRANDKRIPDDNAQGLVNLDAGRVRTWCAPVCIDYPGVSLDEAARLFGVNRTTVSRWASPPAPEDKQCNQPASWWQAVQAQMREAGDDPRFGRPSVYRVAGKRLMLEHEHNRANPKRSVTRVWTPGFTGLDPGGAVWSPAWGELRVGLVDRLEDGFVQRLYRVDRALGLAEGASAPGSHQAESDKPAVQAPASRVFQWLCPEQAGGCGRAVYKLYLPMPNWTLIAATHGGAAPVERDGPAFLCRRCAGLIYESAERSATPGRRVDGSARRVDAWDRFIRRLSGGALAGGDCPAP